MTQQHRRGANTQWRRPINAPRGQRRSQTYHEVEGLVDHARAVDDLDDVVGAAVLQHAALDVDVLLVYAHHEVAVQNEAVVGVAKR